MPLPSIPHRDYAHDAIVWLALGIVTVAALYRARRILIEVTELTIVTKEEKPQEIIGQHTEDAISVDTLGELYHSPNWDIRQASVRILVERAVRGGNLDLLIENAASKDKATREKALVTLAYLINSSVGVTLYKATMRDYIAQSIKEPPLIKVVVDTLVSYLKESRKRVHHPHTDWKLRTKSEKSALTILNFVLRASSDGMVHQWLHAGLISRWLARYPFGGVENKHLRGEAAMNLRKSLVDSIKADSTDDRDLYYVFRELSYDNEAEKQLKKYFLMGTEVSPEDSWASKPMFLIRESSPDGGRSADNSNDDDGEAEAEAVRRRRRTHVIGVGEDGLPIVEDRLADLEHDHALV